MSVRHSNDELFEIAREGTDAEAETAIDILESRGAIPEDSFEERNGQTMNESRGMV